LGCRRREPKGSPKETTYHPLRPGQTTASTACNAPIGARCRSGVHDHWCSLGRDTHINVQQVA
jgi:hypothetical protein